jgi:hypothetical protein
MPSRPGSQQQIAMIVLAIAAGMYHASPKQKANGSKLASQS